MTRRVLFACFLSSFLLGCASGSEQDTADADSSAVDDSAAKTSTTDAGSAANDSIPMTVSFTLPSSSVPMGKIHGGTFQGEARGARCEHLADGPNEWKVIYPGSEDTLQVGPVTLDVGRLAGGKTSSFNLMAVVGTIAATGQPSTPLTHHISTARPGAQAMTMGSGTVTVTRDGQKVRFEMDAVSGTTKEPLKMALVCEREGKWV